MRNTILNTRFIDWLNIVLFVVLSFIYMKLNVLVAANFPQKDMFRIIFTYPNRTLLHYLIAVVTGLLIIKALKTVSLYNAVIFILFCISFSIGDELIDPLFHAKPSISTIFIDILGFATACIISRLFIYMKRPLTQNQS